jgi:hypothetical protein
MRPSCLVVGAAAVCVGFTSVVRPAQAQIPGCQTRTFTSTADFMDPHAYWININTTGTDQLTVRGSPKPLPYLWAALSGLQRGTIVRIDTENGVVVGEYQSVPGGRSRNPSRTTVDVFGNVWCGNRDETYGDRGSVVKIGLVVGGRRVAADGTPDANGQYLKHDPPDHGFAYCTCQDRDGDGLIKTSRGLTNVLSWPDFGDGQGGARCGPNAGPALVEDAEDECILVYQRTHGYAVKHVSVQGDFIIQDAPAADTGP